MFKVISYYTKNTPYEEEIKILEESLKKFGIKYQFYDVLNQGSWQANICLKPEIVKKALMETDEDLLYIDADAEIQSELIYFSDFLDDLGVHYRRGTELLSGTVYFKNNEKVKKLVDYWVKEQQENPLMWDQHSLNRVVNRWKEILGIKVKDIPVEYCFVFDSQLPLVKPIIIHNQASRRFKKSVKVQPTNIPDKIMGIKVRKLTDGTFSLPRSNHHIEEMLSEHFIKYPNENRWYPKINLTSKNIFDLLPLFKGKVCYLIGKGPSLDRLTANWLPVDCPILCINESIIKVESLGIKDGLSLNCFAIQQDNKIGKMDIKSPIFISKNACLHYYDIENIYLYYPEQYSQTDGTLTVLMAITIAKSLGSVGFKLLCFDACISGNTDYALCINKKSTEGGSPSRFLNHKFKIERFIGNNHSIEWVHLP